MVNAKDFAIAKATEIQQISQYIKYSENKEVRVFGIERIYKLAEGILEHLEYLDVLDLSDIKEETK